MIKKINNFIKNNINMKKIFFLICLKIKYKFYLVTSLKKILINGYAR